MSPSKSIFLNDVPVATIADNKLWATDSSVMQEVHEVANAILTENGRLTFAVHGAWGAGKTSFLQMVQHVVMEQMQPQDVTFCWYEASAYQGVDTPETTIALRIWNVLGGEEPQKRFAQEAYDGLAKYMQGILADDFVGSDAKERVKPYQLLQVLARRTGQLADFPRLLEEVLVAGGPDDLPKKLVLIVDDLDRCRSDFIGSILDVLQRFSSVKNLFVVLGVDREVLLTAIRERYQEVISRPDEHLALEKYIQYTIDLPEPTAEELTKYIRECLFVEDSDEEIDKRVLETILGNEHYFVAGVRTKTPRTIKRSINAIRPTLKMRLEQSSVSKQISSEKDEQTVEKSQQLSEEGLQFIIKEQLLAYNWRDFYQQHFKRTYQDRNAWEFFRQLEGICAALYSEKRELTPEEQRDRRAMFDLRLDRMKRRELPEAVKLDIPDELAKFLAMSPQWFYGRETYGPRTDTETDFVEQLAAVTVGENLDEEFLKFYLQSEQADAVGDAKTSAQAAAKAYDLVRRNKSKFGKDIPPRLGNLGVNAEKYKAQELAEAIFRLALDMDEHSGVLQQFASYILDNRPDLYDEADAILAKLQTGQHANHRHWRTLQLLIQLRSQTGQEIEEDLIQRLIEAAEGEGDVRQLGTILDALVRAGRLESSVKLFSVSVERFPSRNARYTLQRMVADALARQPEIKGEFIAMDLYRQILANPKTMDSGDEPHVMHNYATLLYKHDYDDEAGCLWYTAYQNYPSARMDGGIRRAYSMYLLRTDRKDLAQKVIEGEPIDAMVLIPAEKTLPERFSEIDLPDVLSESGKSTVFSCMSEPGRG